MSKAYADERAGLENGSQIKIHVADKESAATNPYLRVEVEGPLDGVTDTVNLLAWLIAATTMPKYEEAFTLCFPVLETLDHSDAPAYSIHVAYRPLGHVMNFGQCWKQLFRNPVIVDGYPLLKRIEEDDHIIPGLELPLEIIIALAGARSVSCYDGQLMIKGFSKLLVPTMLEGRCLVWHLLVQNDRERLPHYAWKTAAITTLDDDRLKADDIESFRHFVGWCGQAECVAGMSLESLFNKCVADTCKQRM